MNFFNILVAILCIWFLGSCSTREDYVITQKDIIPEGTAFNINTNTVYIGSIFRQKIIGILPNGEITDVLGKEYFGDLSPIGMEMDNGGNILWVNVALAPIVNQTNINKWKTGIRAFDMESKKMIRKYDLDQKAFLNDLTVAQSGDVYATESAGGKIYKVDKHTDRLEPFVELKDYHFPNGIVYYHPKNCLFTATDEGILKIDLTTKSVVLINTDKGVNTKTIDGLAMHKNYFIGHQSSKVSRFYFNDDVSKITREEILDAGEEFDSSTTGEIGGDYYYFIVNSQIRSGINQENKTIKPLDSLENVIIRKVKL